MDVREKYVMQKVSRKEKTICPNCIHHNLCIAENNQPCFECNRFIDAHGVTVQEWISVKDRLPNVNTNKSEYERKGVIVIVDGCLTKSVYRVYERACNRGKTVYRWKYPWDTISDENITHWCELSQPPKGE